VPDYALPAREYAVVFGTAVLITFLAASAVRLFAVKIGAVTPIRDRDVHTLPTPRLGGVAVYLGFAGALGVAYQLPMLHAAFHSSSQIVGVLIAGGAICLIGAVDDKFDLDPIAKLAGQVLVAVILVLFGVQWIQLWLPADGGTVVSLDQYQSVILTVMITLVLINAMNFIDGLDGLLAGVAAISGIGLFIFSVRTLELSANDISASQAPLVSAVLVGSCLGFLPHNFFPARIFMGDSGSMFIGLAMSAAITEVGGTVDAGRLGLRSTVALLSPLLVALAVVLIPVLDFLLAVIRRTREGRHPFSADNRHLHHRMLAVGHHHRQAVLVFYLWALVLSAIAVALGFTAWQNVVWPALFGVLVATIATIWPWIRARRLRRARRTAGVVAEVVGEPAAARNGGPPAPTERPATQPGTQAGAQTAAQAAQTGAQTGAQAVVRP
jgi:UDP-GlcNAc:undecaprenyl-phosphate GlcNAc-1-phosphate transferase